MECDLLRIGTVTVVDLSSVEPGSADDYHPQPYRLLQAKGFNCTAKEFAEWFVVAQGGSLCGDDGQILDFGDVPDSCLNQQIELYLDDYRAVKHASDW